MAKVIFKADKSAVFFIVILLGVLAITWFKATAAFLPRYVLFLYPFYFTLFAYSLVKILGRLNKVIVLITVIFMAISVKLWFGHRGGTEYGGWVLESNLEYLDQIKAHRSACKLIYGQYPSSTVLTSWPQVIELESVFAGYVSSPVKAIFFPDLKKEEQEKIDLVYYSDQSYEPKKMKELMKTLNLELIGSFNCNGKNAEIYRVLKE
ncbi:MAG: hypothetical protein WC628_03860 [Candidatus Omnitrophota bacterium]